MPGGNVPKDGPALVKGALVLTGNIELNVFIAIAPVWRQMVSHTERPFGENIELYIRAVADDAPHLFPPGISIFQKGI